MRPRIVVGPLLAQLTTVATRHMHRLKQLARLEARGHQDHVHCMTRAAGVNDLAALDAIHRLGDQRHIRTLERLIPAVVDQDALTVRRVVRQAFCDQIRAVTDLAHEVLGELAPLAVVAVVHRPLGMRPVRVEPYGGQQTITEAPHQTEAIPRVVVGHVLQQPARLGADRAVVVLRRSGPLR